MIHHMNPYNLPSFMEPVCDLKILLAGSWVAAWMIVDQRKGRGRFSNSGNHDLSGVHNASI